MAIQVDHSQSQGRGYFRNLKVIRDADQAPKHCFTGMPRQHAVARIYSRQARKGGGGSFWAPQSVLRQ